MKITASAKELSAVASLVAIIAKGSESLFQGAGVLIEAKKDWVEIQACDSSTMLRFKLAESDTLEEGMIVVSADTFAKALKAVSGDGLVTIGTEKTKVSIRAGTSRFSLPSEPGDGFRFAPRFDTEGPVHTVAWHRIASLIRRTVFVADETGTRYATNQVVMAVRDGSVSLTTTDGRRIARARIEHESTDGDFTVSVPPKAFDTLKRVVAAASTAVTSPNLTFGISPEGNLLLVKVGDRAVLASCLVAGDYPDLEPPLAISLPVSASVPREAFLSLVTRVTGLGFKGSNGALFTFGPNGIGLVAKSSGLGEAASRLPVDGFGFGEEEVRIFTDPSFVADALKAMETETVAVSIGSEIEPIFLREDDLFTYVVASMQQPDEFESTVVGVEV